MANNLNIAEYTLAEVSAAATACNVLGVAAGNRPYWDTAMTIRISDHADNDGAEADDPNKMALFVSKRHGLPWTKDVGIQHIVVQADADPVANATRADVTVLFPNYDYSTF